MDDWKILGWVVAGFLISVMWRDIIAPRMQTTAQKQSDAIERISALESHIATLQEKQAQHDGLLVMVTRLDERVGQLTSQIANQGPVMAHIVAAAIKEVFSAMGVRRTANAN